MTRERCDLCGGRLRTAGRGGASRLHHGAVALLLELLCSLCSLLLVQGCWCHPAPAPPLSTQLNLGGWCRKRGFSTAKFNSLESRSLPGPVSARAIGSWRCCCVPAPGLGPGAVHGVLPVPDAESRRSARGTRSPPWTSAPQRVEASGQGSTSPVLGTSTGLVRDRDTAAALGGSLRACGQGESSGRS